MESKCYLLIIDDPVNFEPAGGPEDYWGEYRGSWSGPGHLLVFT
jgi:hypothetical protein